MRFLPLLLLFSACGRTGDWTLGDESSSTDLSASSDLAITDLAFRACVPGSLTIARAEPTVLFALDRSGSMNTSFGTSTRWRALTEALATALPPADETMATGALVFPAGQDQAAGCNVSSSASLSPALGNVGALVSLMQSTQPAGETPTADAMTAAAAILNGLHTATTARAIVLATDGAPDCNASLNAQTCTCATTQGGGGGPGGGNRCNQATQCLDDTRTVATVKQIAEEGLPTYVIGIASGDSVFVDTLNAIAIAGGRPATGATSYYPATSEAQLESALTQIRAQVGTCEYLVTNTPTDGTVTISIDGTLVPYDPTGASGWTWTDRSNGQLVVNGVDCTQLAGDSNPVVTADAICGDGGA